MEVKEILENACFYLGLEKEFEPFFEETEETISSETQKEFDKLLRALNMVVSKVASDYIPVLKQERLEVIDNKILFSDFSGQVNQIYRIFSNNKNEKYKIFEDYVEIKTKGFVCVEYSFIPKQLDVEDDLNFFSGRLSLFTLAMGVASEYCFLTGLFDDAKIWDERFKEGVQSSIRKRSIIKIPKRRWF